MCKVSWIDSRDSQMTRNYSITIKTISKNRHKFWKAEEEQSNKAITAAIMQNNNCLWSALKNMPRTMHHTLSKMWCTIQNFLFQIVLGLNKANHCVENCNESNKAILSNYVHSWRVPLREERQRATTHQFPSPKCDTTNKLRYDFWDFA